MYTHNCLIKLFLFKPDRICLQGVSARGGCPYAGPSALQAGEARAPVLQPVGRGRRRRRRRRRLPSDKKEHHGSECAGGCPLLPCWVGLAGHPPLFAAETHGAIPASSSSPYLSILLHGMWGMRPDSERRLINERRREGDT